MTSQAAHCLSQLVGQITNFANGTRQFCRTARARYDQIGCLCRAGSVSEENLSVWAELMPSFRELADPARRFSTQIWLSALVLLIVICHDSFSRLFMRGKLKQESLCY